jgi:type I restriction enzyme, S subunit
VSGWRGVVCCWKEAAMSDQISKQDDLPSSWLHTQLGRVVNYGRTTKVEPSDIPSDAWVLELEDIEKDTSRILQRMTFSQRQSKSTKNKFVAGDVLYGKLRPYLNKVVIADQPGYCTTEIVPISAGLLDNRFLFYWLKHPTFLKYVEAESHGLNMPRLGTGTGIAAPFVLAPREEQTRIADQLDALLARIKACHQRLDATSALLKRFRRAVLDTATTGALTQDWREHNSAPEWTLVSLSDIAEVVGGVTKDSKRQSVADEEVPYLRVANVQRGYLDLSEIKTIRVPTAKLEKLLLEPGDVLFNEGGDLDKLGRGWVWDGQLDRCTFQNHVFRARLKDSSNQPKFISWWGNSRGLDYFIRSGKQTTNLASINKRTLEALPISLPSPEEQKEIVRRVDVLLDLAARIEARFESMRIHALRLGPQVLAKAFRGELVQQNLQDEPASVLLQRIVGKQPEKMKSTRGRSRINKPEPVGGPSITLPAWSTLPAGAWAAQVPADEHTATAQLIAVLKAWNKPAPQDAARLATLLCLQPRLLTIALPAQHATQWCRLVGDAATPLPRRVVTLQSAFNIPWRNAISKMRARGDLIESDSGAQGTWAVGPGAAGVHTAGWPDGRAGWVVYYLKTHGVEAVLPTLETEVQEFVYARAA